MRALAVILLLVVASALAPQPTRAALTPLTNVQSGSLIRGETFSAVYYIGEDGFRYVFPNDKAYFTWYAHFDDVVWVSDADLATIQIGGNVTYKPGIKMVKIASDPKTYAVDEGGRLRWVRSESVAVELYGTDWGADIDDVPDAFFGNYRMGADIEEASDFDPASVSATVEDIDDDKDLQSATVLNISDNFYNNTSVTIKAGTAVRWYNNGANKHTATASDLSWGTGTIQPGGNFARYFNEPGTYNYFCSYHPTMTATIIVE